MTAKNDITGDSIHTRGSSDEYRYNWDRIFAKKKKCGACESTDIEELVGDNSMIVAGQTYTITCHYTRCKNCGSDTATSDQSKKNKQIMQDKVAEVLNLR